ncbi:MAG: glycosyltransferase family 4 protein [Nitrospinota bacterium]
MKIALLRSSVHPWGGAERYVWSLAGELSRRGHEVHVFARRWEEPPGSSVTFHKVPVLGGLSFLKVLTFALLSQAMLRGESFDIIHSFDRTLPQDIYRAGDGLHREWLRVSAPHLPFWLRWSRWLNPLHWSILWLEGKILREKSCRVTAISKRGAKEIARHFPQRAGSVPVLFNGVDLEEFSPEKRRFRQEMRERLGLGLEDFVVLFVGTGFFRKGLGPLIRALGLLKARGKEVRLLVAGRSAPYSYRRLARDLGVEGWLFFAGGSREVSKLYGASDAFVLPALYEPFGNVCLEALASGLPTILSSRSGGAEILTHGEDGLLVSDPGDPEEIARLIERVMDKEFSRKLGEAARRLAERFTIAANADATEALYREVLEAKNRQNAGLPREGAPVR